MSQAYTIHVNKNNVSHKLLEFMRLIEMSTVFFLAFTYNILCAHDLLYLKAYTFWPLKTEWWNKQTNAQSNRILYCWFCTQANHLTKLNLYVSLSLSLDVTKNIPTNLTCKHYVHLQIILQNTMTHILLNQIVECTYTKLVQTCFYCQTTTALL